MNAPRDVVGAIRHWVAERPDHRAVTFLEDGARETESLTYGELDRRARALAARLASDGLTGQRAMLIFEPGLDFVVAFVGCLYAGVAPVPAYPPEPHRLEHTLARLKSIVADARAPVVLTSALIQGFAETLIAETRSDDLAALTWLTPDQTAGHAPDDWEAPTLAPEQLAFLQYTSGSTSQPKGVMVTHGSLWANVEMFSEAFGIDEREVMVTWLPVYHDMGLIGTTLSPLAAGGQTWMMPPHAFLKKPARWLQLMSRVRCTHTAAPNFAYDLAVRKVSAEERAELDLSSVRVMANGAEPVRRDTLERFHRHFAPAGLRADAVAPCYGMAEVGLFISTPPLDRRPTSVSVSKAALEAHRVEPMPRGADGAVDLVSSGVTCRGGEVRITHPETRRALGPAEVGEIWVGGDHVAAGYWGKDELSEETFRARVQDGAGDASDPGSFLRTGDLGFLHEDELYITGRRKDLIIIRGRNLYPQDLEKTMDETRERAPEVRPGCAAAFSMDIDGEEQLVLMQEVEPSKNPDHDAAQVMSVLRDAVARDHEVRAHTVVLLKKGTLPKTSSGKVMRYACRRALLADFASGGLEPLARDSSDGSGGLPAMDPAASAAAADQVIVWWRERAARDLDPQRADDAGTVSPDVLLDLGDQGLLGLQAPRELGGLGLTHGDAARVLCEVAAVDLTLAVLLEQHNALGVGPIVRHGTPLQRETLLPSLGRGHGLAACALVEDGGADPTLFRAKLEEGPDGLRLTGVKVSVAGASWCRQLNVLARHGEGYSFVTLPRGRDGWRSGERTSTLGVRGLPYTAVHFEGVEVSREDVVGEPGQGARVAADALGSARYLLAAAALGAARRALQLMLRFAGRRATSSGWLLDHPATLEAMHASVHEVTALDALLQRLGARLDAGADVPDAALMALKVVGAEALARAAERLVRLLGDRGMIEANFAPKLLRDASALRVLEGTHDALLSQVGRALADDREPLLALLRDLGAEAVAAAVAATLTDALGEPAPSPGTTPSRPNAKSLRAEHRAGALYCAALSQAALEGESEGRLRQAAEEMAQRVAAAAARLRAGSSKERMPSARAMAALVNAACAGVGALDVAGPGVARHIDPSLLSAPPPSEAEPARPAQRRPGRRRSEPRSEAKPRRERPDDEVARLKSWMIGWIARELGTTPRALAQKVGFHESGHTPFSALGIDSVTTVQLIGELEEKLGFAIPATTLREHDSVEALAEALVAGRKKARGA